MLWIQSGFNASNPGPRGLIFLDILGPPTTDCLNQVCFSIEDRRARGRGKKKQATFPWGIGFNTSDLDEKGLGQLNYDPDESRSVICW